MADTTIYFGYLNWYDEGANYIGEASNLYLPESYKISQDIIAVKLKCIPIDGIFYLKKMN